MSVGEGEIVDAEIQPIKDGEVISMNDAIKQEAADPAPRRVVTGSPGFDWVLGGGIPVGVAILLASPPGGGKSTLLVEVLRQIALSGLRTLYCCTEENTKQIARRYERLGSFPPRFRIVHEVNADELIEKIRSEHARVVAVDSLHDIEGVCDDNGMFYSTGSGTSVTLAAKQLRQAAAEMGIPIFMVAHVTKGGGIAGTNTLQHSLDMTLYVNGQQKTVDGRLVIVGSERTLRCDGKNRFAETGRVGHFRMMPDGLHDLGPWRGDRPPWSQSQDAAEAE